MSETTFKTWLTMEIRQSPCVMSGVRSWKQVEMNSEGEHLLLTLKVLRRKVTS